MNLSRIRARCHCNRCPIALLRIVAAVVLIHASGPYSRLHAQTVGGALAAYDFSKDPQQFDLGKTLVEISGLAVDADGRLFAHQDERAVVFELDRGTGRIVRSFYVGRNGLRGDFEGIATAGKRMFLISSDGTLLEFATGADDASVEYARSKIGTRKSCREIEGLEFDATSESLLLACKFTSGKALRDRLLVLRYSIRTRSLDPKPFLSVSLNGLARFGLKPELSPSGIAIDPRTGSIVIVAARENLLVELDRAGAFLGVIELRGKVHHQPEGVAFGADGTLYISDEGRSGRATLTIYPARAGG